MNLLIVEDVTLVAERIAALARSYWGDQIKRLAIRHTLEEAQLYLAENTIDMLFLDLNLNGKDGFELLKLAAAESFKTVVITANKDQAARAFDLGVFDFITKPINSDRFATSMTRFQGSQAHQPVKFLAVKSRGKIDLINPEDIQYIKAAGNYSELILQGETILHQKNLNEIASLLPPSFSRVHRSYIVKTQNIKRLINHGAGKYEAELKSGITIPINKKTWRDNQ